MDDRTAQIAALLHQAAETHHIVWANVDGDDPDWASWYADWLLDHSDLPQLLGARPIRSHLVHDLVDLDRQLAQAPVEGRWEDHYAKALQQGFAPLAA